MRRIQVIIRREQRFLCGDSIIIRFHIRFFRNIVRIRRNCDVLFRGEQHRRKFWLGHRRRA